MVTGASSGIGAATAQAFAHAGARVVLVARNTERLEAVAQGLPHAPVVLTADLGDAAQAAGIVERCVAACGRLDILINNAGLGLAGPVSELKPSDLERVLAVDFLGPLASIRAAVPVMRRQGRGQIINVSSVLAAAPLPYLGGYAAAKAALERASEALRMELRGSGIAISVVRPGTTNTGFSQNRLGSGSERRRIAPKGVPPSRVAATILRAARNEPRRAYVTSGDQIAIWAAQLAPGLVEWVLNRAIRWDSGDNADAMMR